ncbi:MAG TPA: TonB-dependent siderophore receptor [Sphingomicrobium sp.]|nr:TonB-dependent siderophore receptor [Sphingomicrobium sp.]
MLRASVAALLVTTGFIATPALASEVEASTAADAADQSEPIVVVGQRDEYGVKSTSTATKTDTEVKDIPQALTVISESQIEDQQLRSIADVMYLVPGATPGTGESNRDQITLRGQSTTADFFVDGIRDDVQYFRDFYNVDRVEVLKGPNAMIFGRGGGGGIINRVTKRSSLGTHRQLMVAGDSYGGVRLTGDIDQPLGDGIGIRVNGMYENGDSFRRQVDLERYGINPTVGIQAGPDTRIDLSYEYLHDRRTTDRGVPSDQRAGAASIASPAEPLDGFDKIFFGDPDQSFAKADVHLASFAISHQFGEGLTLRNRTLYGHYDKAYQNVYPNGPATTANTVRISAYRDITKRENLFSQTDLIWEGKVGTIDQTLLLGFELGGSDGRNQRLNGVFSSRPGSPSNINVPLTDVTISEPVTFLANGANNGIETSVAALYVQDQIRPAKWLEIVAGLRFDRFKIEVENRATGAETERSDNLWSPRLGLVLKPRDNLSIYASYSRSYLPQAGDQFNSLSPTNATLKPERFDHYEVGAKWEPIEGLLATAAVYRLDRTNTRTSPSGGVVLLSGEQRSKGIELGLERSIDDNWQISAGYAWQKAEVTEATEACASGDCEVPLVPRHSFSLWSRYDFSKHFSAGLGVIARSKSFASLGNTVQLPGYARVDAALFYQLTDGIEAQVNVENIFGADYFATAHNDNNIAPGAPTNVKAAVRFTF